LPGGAIESGEFSTDGLVREMREELSITIEIGRLVWIVENLFEYRGTAYTEYGFYYECDCSRLAPPTSGADSPARNRTSSSAGSDTTRSRRSTSA